MSFLLTKVDPAMVEQKNKILVSCYNLNKETAVKN